MPKPKPIKSTFTGTFTIPLMGIVKEVADVTNKNLETFRDLLAEEIRLSAKVEATAPHRWKKEAARLSLLATKGSAKESAAALRELEEAGGPDEFVKTRSAMHEINSRVLGSFLNQNHGLWDAWADAAKAALESLDTQLLEEWESIFVLMALPVPPRVQGQFTNSDPMYPAGSVLKQAQAHVGRFQQKGAYGYASPLVNIKSNDIMRQVFGVSKEGGLV